MNVHARARVRTYQSAHKMVSKWPSSAETSDSQSHLTTLHSTRQRAGPEQTGGQEGRGQEDKYGRNKQDSRFVMLKIRKTQYMHAKKSLRDNIVQHTELDVEAFFFFFRKLRHLDLITSDSAAFVSTLTVGPRFCWLLQLFFISGGNFVVKLCWADATSFFFQLPLSHGLLGREGDY